MTFTELQIIFESNAYLPPNFLLNADFQNLKLYFNPLYFFAMHKREGITVSKCISVFLCRFRPRFACDLFLLVVLYCKHLFLIPLIITQRKLLTICWLTDRQMDIINPEFYFRYNFANQYALLWTPNAWKDMLRRIYTPCLFFQCVFTHFQCVIMLLRALSVALLYFPRLSDFGLDIAIQP